MLHQPASPSSILLTSFVMNEAIDHGLTDGREGETFSSFSFLFSHVRKHEGMSTRSIFDRGGSCYKGKEASLGGGGSLEITRVNEANLHDEYFPLLKRKHVCIIGPSYKGLLADITA